MIDYLFLAKLFIYAITAKTSVERHIPLVARALFVSLLPALLEYGLKAYVTLGMGGTVEGMVSTQEIIIVAVQFGFALGLFQILDRYEESIAQWLGVVFAGMIVLYWTIPWFVRLF